MNLESVRELFPYIKTGKIYFNHASTAPLSQRVLDSLNKYFYERSTNNIDDYPDFLKTVISAKEKLSRFNKLAPGKNCFC